MPLPYRPRREQGLEDLPAPPQCVSLLSLFGWSDIFTFLVYIVKDLVPDLTQFYKQYKSIQPYLQNDNVPEREHLQSPEDRRKVSQLYSYMAPCLT
jgi:hypothetical protein